MIISQEEMKIRKFGKLRMKFPREILSGSNKKETWICDCGRESNSSINKVISGHTTSCGRCNEISAEEMSVRKFGKLRMKFPRIMTPGSAKKETWICDCGKEKIAKIISVVSGSITSCGRCNEISAKEMSVRKFGKLQMKFPKAILPGSEKKETWICDCGKEKEINVCYVLSGDTTTCGNCRDSIQNWYSKNKDILRSLKYPIRPNDFPSGGPIPLENIKSTGHKHKFRCVLCGKIYFPRFGDIKLNNGGLTCGCSSYKISFGQKEVSLFIESLGFETELEYKVNRLSYDVYVPEKNLLIEYDGIHWHSFSMSKERDLRKEQNAMNFGYKFLRISEDGWVKNRKRTEGQLKKYLSSLFDES